MSVGSTASTSRGDDVLLQGVVPARSELEIGNLVGLRAVVARLVPSLVAVLAGDGSCGVKPSRTFVAIEPVTAPTPAVDDAGAPLPSA